MESLLNNSTNRMLVLLQNFFYFGSIENFSIFCGFIRAMAVKSVKQLFVLCKILAPFIYRLTTKPDIFGEVTLAISTRISLIAHHTQQIVLELLRCLENIDLSPLALEVDAEITPTNPIHYLDSTVDFL